jgi:hypothetical protein
MAARALPLRRDMVAPVTDMIVDALKIVTTKSGRSRNCP